MTAPAISFEGRVAVITGSGRGIGRAHAIELARRGAKVVVNDLDRDVADGVVTDIVAAGGAAVASYTSVSTEAGGARLIGEAVDAFGTVHVVVNNAGLRRPGYFGSISLDDLDTVLDSHLRAAFFVTQPAWRHMQEQGYGRIVMTSSSSGMFSNQGLSNYAAAKSGIYGLMKALAYEGADLGIRTNAVLPFAATKRPGQVRVPDMARERARFISQQDVDSISAERSAPELIAHLVAYLASDRCAVNGEAFSACNGRYARVFVGVAQGWLAPDVESLDAETLESHLEEIRDLHEAKVPMWIFDEQASVVRRLIELGRGT